jgi:uncharacterized membrane protein YuzA (DUF378 family)
MKLNDHGLMARFYLWSYPSALPNNLCSYFWKLVAAIVLLPLTWATFWINDDNIPFPLRAIIGVLLQGIVGFLGFAFVAPFFGVWTPLEYLGLGVVIAAIICGVGYFFLERTTPVIPKALSEFASISYERGKAVKDNYCPRIEWTQGEK